MNKSDTRYPLLSNTLETVKNLIAYDLSSSRVVFEHEGDEIVFINESWIGRIRIYLNGDLAYRGADWTGMIRSSGWFLHKGKTYRITTTLANLITFAQSLTLSVDGSVVDTKEDAFYGKLSVKEVGRLMFGCALIGFLIFGIGSFIKLLVV